MKRLVLIFITFYIVIFSCKIDYQDNKKFGYIIAGDSYDCEYFEIWDTLTSNGGIDIPPNYEELSLDINKDSIDDLMFKTFGGGGQGAYVISSFVKTFNHTYICIDTCNNSDG